MIRIGVLSDLHCELVPSGSRWINPYEPEHLDRRIDAALGWFAEAQVDVILLLGDSVQFPNVGDADHVFARLARAGVAPLATVNGNHDLRLGDAFGESAGARGIRLLHRSPLDVQDLPLHGVEIDRGRTPPQYVGRLGGDRENDGLVVLASHFPILSEASRVTASGLPYPGDLVNRAAIEGELRSGGPTVVLCGHIHARCSTHHGPLLQLAVGALIEPPFDATVVEVDVTTLSVRRTARRLGAVAVTDPVFSPDEERWRRTSDGWHVEAAAAT